MFEGFLEFAAPDDDPLREKWGAIRRSTDVSWPATINAWVMNREINRFVTYSGEAAGEDKWQTPAVTLASRSGDCEDFALLKRAILLRNGCRDEDLRLELGQIKSLGGNRDHAWLNLRSRADGRWRVLDVMFDDLIDPRDYVNWLPLAACCGDQVLRYGREVVLSEDANAGRQKT